MATMSSDKATRFYAWLQCISAYLPKSMTISEASSIFLRRCEDEQKEKEKNGTQS